MYICNFHPYFDNGGAVNATQNTITRTTAGALTDARELNERLLLFRRTSFYISMHNTTQYTDVHLRPTLVYHNNNYNNNIIQITVRNNILVPTNPLPILVYQC